MNIAFFLIPKTEVAFIKYESTMRQALEKMEYHRYTSVPLIDQDGKYAGTLTEGDLLWKMKNTPGMTIESTSKVMVAEIPLHHQNAPIHIDAEMEDIIAKSIEQNFIPVVDDQEIFIGIIRRREILEYCSEHIIKTPHD
ncbi:CBS domain-containing protein [Bacillus salacetis]|uniref:CBS domain-containing protein n=1 Tax=Bacillus salacetis TaxID=2315464 RepID=A0A3A1QU18_9BACI|nr:CBS domain-containing protein [Bacillus salacetis]RIW31357.1 CBS domain-containing protein [Bacillus salacetis]